MRECSVSTVSHEPEGFWARRGAGRKTGTTPARRARGTRGRMSAAIMAEAGVIDFGLGGCDMSAFRPGWRGRALALVLALSVSCALVPPGAVAAEPPAAKPMTTHAETLPWMKDAAAAL